MRHHLEPAGLVIFKVKFEDQEWTSGDRYPKSGKPCSREEQTCPYMQVSTVKQTCMRLQVQGKE